MAKTAATLRVLLITCEAVWIEQKGKRFYLTNARDILRKGAKRWHFIHSRYNEKTNEVDSEHIELYLDWRRSVLYDYDKGLTTLMHRDKEYQVTFKLVKGANPRDIHHARVGHTTRMSGS